MDLLASVRRIINPVRNARPGAGLYSFIRSRNGGKTHMHLRLEQEGESLLMVNAARAYQLNPSAALMAYMNLNGVSEKEAVRSLSAWFNAPRAILLADYREMAAQLDILTQPDQHCAVCELDVETAMPFSSKPSAPYRMDLALTYRCQNECAHCYNARARSHPEMPAAQWTILLDKVRQAGIPHVVFTGGEPTLRADLPELIAHATRNGQIAGLNTNGRRLSQPGYVQTLEAAGLDHVQITLE